MIAPKGATRNMRVTRYHDGTPAKRRDVVVVEEPMEIRLSWLDEGRRRVEPLAVTMRTPGDDFQLAAGFLFGEGVVTARDDIVALTYCQAPGEQEYNVVEVRLAPGVAVDWASLERNFYTTSSCGVCGKASLEAVTARGCSMLDAGFALDAATITRLPDKLGEGQGVFARTGGLHAAGLFDAAGVASTVMEDVGRHNAVDKVVGHTFLEGALPAGDRVLVVSGRASFELVQKAVAAGIPMLVAVGAPSSLAVDLARRFGQTLVGFARDGTFNVYTGSQRIS
jgi:FdhD protein